MVCVMNPQQNSRAGVTAIRMASRVISSQGSESLPFTARPLIRRSTSCACATAAGQARGVTRASACRASRSCWPKMRFERSTPVASCPDASACATRERLRISSPTAQSTSGRASPSARNPAIMRSIRGTSPASIASRSPKTSYRATFRTACSTSSTDSMPGSKSKPSFMISWCAASRLPSTLSASHCKVAGSACCD